MIEVTGNDIAALSDADLRSLIGLLCEAELRSADMPTAGVTWGGHQNAKDGGIDVRVEVLSSLHKDSFIPRPNTGFQVKKPDMPYAAIINEMRPNGELRQVIKDLVNSSGAYIIVSSQGSTSDSALMNRRTAMQQAISDCPSASKAMVDFYDRERIAAWVRSHPSLVLWLRNKTGRPIQGWRAYENWSRSPQGIEEEYMIDEHVRLHNSATPRSNGLSAIDGINQMRTLLYSPKSSIRLVGLSGVGKTKLLQALFDKRIGDRPLNQSRVFYCDISDNPSPAPLSFAEQLIVLRKPAILAVDNCPPDLHRKLTSACSAEGSLVSLITVEYDVREDQPEETEVFLLEPASDEIIKKIILVRYNHISEIDARTIAKFSGGNARIAIALANTIQRGENLANLRDEDLFVRLFHQRNTPDSYLLKVAEVCSLVYSFDCRTVEGVDNELRLLGSLIGMSIREVYGSISELMRRDLVQQRGIWRAVLPHAVANKLAKRALENIPLDIICSVFEIDASERLLKSFSRRLSYLHECNEAIEISRRWLSKNGLLGDISHLNELGISLFQNMAPINPELTLSSIESMLNHQEAEKFFSRNNKNFSEFTRILRSIAYDKELFNRSVELLCRFALSEKPRENNNSIRDLLKSLFYLYLSGTHATAKQRLSIITNLMCSKNDEQIDLGISLLSAALETYHFSSHYGFEFGARSRDYGFTPQNRQDVYQWYKIFIEYSVTIAISNQPIADKIKRLLAEKFRGLWVEVGMHDELENATSKILNNGTWREGWISVRTIKRFDIKDIKPEAIERLNNLDKMLKPTTLIELAKLYSFSNHGNALDLIDAIESEDENGSDDYSRLEEVTRALGRSVGADDEVFKTLLPSILSEDGYRLYHFGQGLAEGTIDPEKMWQDFCKQLTLLDETNRKHQVVGGFINGINKRDTILAEKFLDETIMNTVLAASYPWLQTTVAINQKGMERLRKSLELETVPISQYKNLAYGRVHEAISDDDLCELLRLISSKDNGLEVSLKILQMRLHGHEKGKQFSDNIISLGQEILLGYQFSRKDNRRDYMSYEIGSLIKVCFNGRTAEECARKLCEKIYEAYAEYNIHSMDYNEVIKALAITQPKVFLDVFLGEDFRDDYLKEGMLSVVTGWHVNPMSYINEDLIINWCEEKPEARYPEVASAIIPYQKNEKQNTIEWTPLALRIINCSPRPVEALNKLRLAFRPRSWSGSRAEIMESRLCLISELKTYKNRVISDWAFNEEKIFRDEIRSEREWELKTERDLSQSFE